MCHISPILSLGIVDYMANLSAVSIENDDVGAAVKAASDATAGGQSLDAVGDSGGGGKTLERLEVKGKADNVRSSHGGAADGVGGSVRADP